MLIDRVHILIQSGNGGNGCESYYRRTDKKVVPNGGDGGRGGRVTFRADHNAPSLGSFKFRQYLIAEHGGHGSSNRRRGKNGKDLLILVPVGTRLYDRERNLLIRALTEQDDEVVVLEGGRPGLGNDGGKRATRGEPGLRLDLLMRYHIPADAFFVGLPNSGKSTLLNNLTRAHAKQEDYPFATKKPEIGVCAFSDYERVMLCELPSVYDGSSEGRGRGSDFLRHLDYAKFIIYVLDPVSDFAPNLKAGQEMLRQQLLAVNPKYAEIPYVVVINKMDQEAARTRLAEEGFDETVPCFPISALTQEGVPKLLGFLRERFFPVSHA